jgi:hypothetical protein
MSALRCMYVCLHDALKIQRDKAAFLERAENNSEMRNVAGLARTGPLSLTEKDHCWEHDDGLEVCTWRRLGNSDTPRTSFGNRYSAECSDTDPTSHSGSRRRQGNHSRRSFLSQVHNPHMDGRVPILLPPK